MTNMRSYTTKGAATNASMTSGKGDSMYDKVNGYSKEQQLRGHQKPVKQPKLVNKRPRKKKKHQPLKPELYKGRVIPKKSVRGRITRSEYIKTQNEHGFECFFCGSGYNLECHHVVEKGYSKHKEGRGVWRNLRFLCDECHRGENGVHQNKAMMEELQAEHERLYGKWFYCDVYDLFKMGLIPNTEPETYESFMKEQAVKASESAHRAN